MTIEHYQTAFQPLLYGVGLAIVLTLLLKETGSAARSTTTAAAYEELMTTTTGTGKYEALLERCRNLEPVPTAVAHPCEAQALAGAVEAGAKGLITPILVGPAAKIREIAMKGRHRSRWLENRRRRSQPCGRREGGRAGSHG